MHAAISLVDIRWRRPRALSDRIAREPIEPLWKRAPQRDECGRGFGDFMMVFPGLRRKPAHGVRRIIDDIEPILIRYRHAVVFADLNLRLNVLWVTVRPLPGICLELPAAIHRRVPEA